MRHELEPSGGPRASEASRGSDLAELLSARAGPARSDGKADARLVARLESLTAGVDGAEAKALVEALEGGRFDTLRAEDGRSLRFLAVEALLRLGYPWALQVSWRDLDWYRSQVGGARPERRWVLGLLAALLAALAGLGAWALGGAPPPAGPPPQAPHRTPGP